MEDRLLLSVGRFDTATVSHEAWRSMTFTVGSIEMSDQFGTASQDVAVASSDATQLIGLPEVFDRTSYRGEGYSVAVIDTGIDYNHASLGGGWGNRVIAGYDFVNDDADPLDDNGHGTHVAGIIGSSHATYGGVAPDVNLIALKVLGANGSGSFGDIEDALQWVAVHQAEYNIVAVNLSISDSGNHMTNPYSFLEDEFTQLKGQGVFIATASGNDFYTHGSVQGLGYPSISDNTVSVGAVWTKNMGAIGWANGARDWSTAADRVTSFTQRSSGLDLFAPGALITSTYMGGGFASMGGTSMASPVVAGAAVLLRQAADDLQLTDLANQDALRDLMKDTAVSIVDGDDENDNVTNTNLTFDRLDLAAAMNFLLDGTATSAFDASFDSATGELTVTAQEAATITITSDAGLVQLSFNGTLYTGLGDLAAQDVTLIRVEGSTFADSIDASGVTATDFTSLTSLIILSGDGNDSIQGSELTDGINGGLGDDVIDGNGGNDLINGSHGNDSLHGGSGIDLIFGGSGKDLISGGADDDVLVGQGSKDTLQGDEGNDWLLGGSSNDLLFGGLGDDLLQGGNGNDRLEGESGADTLAGGAGRDRLSGGDGDDGLAGNDGCDTLNGGRGNDTALGGADNDTLLGGSGQDLLLGGQGNDWLRGQGGSRDTLAGEEGADHVDNPGGHDRVYESFAYFSDWADNLA